VSQITIEKRCAERTKLGDTSLPEEQPEMLDDEFLQKLHHVLLEVCIALLSIKTYSSQCQIHVEEGAMVCQNCEHVYAISSGIPNMVRTLRSAHLFSP
jgi:multifunctional methyltransferase subunit TRM112